MSDVLSHLGTMLNPPHANNLHLHTYTHHNSTYANVAWLRTHTFSLFLPQIEWHNRVYEVSIQGIETETKEHF